MPAVKARRLQIATVVLSILMLASFAVSAWSFASAHANSCASRNVTLSVLHDILATAQRQGAQEPRSSTQEAQAAAFYAAAFDRIGKARCS